MYIFLGYLFAVITAGCWTQNSIIYSYVGKRIGSGAVTHIRLWIAFPATLIIHLLFRGTLLPEGYSSLSYFLIGTSGIFGFFIADLFIFKAFEHIGARKTMVIMTLSPIFSSIISWILFHEVLTAVQIAGVLATIGGVIAVILSEINQQIPAGGDLNIKSKGKTRIRWIVFALAGAVTQAIGVILAKAGLVEGMHPVSGNVVRIGAGLGGLILFTLLRGEFISDFAKMKDGRSLYLLTSAALVGPVFGMLLALYAFSWAPVGIVTALIQLTPVMLLPIDRFYFKKQIPPGAVLGTLLAVTGAAVLFTAN